MRHDYSIQSTAMEMFTQEITDYAEYLKPTFEEHAIRTYVFKATEEFVTRLWNEAKVHVYGSFNTQLYLPGSDMDIVVVLDRDKPGLLRTLANKIRSSGFGVSVEAILQTRVPIVKFQERRTGIHVDISLNQLDGFKTGDVVQQFMAQMPTLRPMTMLIKQFLKSKPMNFCEVHQGGLGSFSVTLMVMSFLQMHPLIQSRRMDPLLNLGVLVIEFFELYGLCFNYNTVSISVARGGSYIQKGGDGTQNERFGLTLINPVADHNVAKGTRNMSIIRAAFVLAYQELTSTIRRRQEELDRKPKPTWVQPGSSMTSETKLRQHSMIKEVFRLPNHVEKNRSDIRAIFEEGDFQVRFGEMARERGHGHGLADMPLVGDESQPHKVNEDDLIRAYRRHFPQKSDLTTIREFATSFKRKLVRQAISMEPLRPLLSDAEYESLIVEIDRIDTAISRAKAGSMPSKKRSRTFNRPGLISATGDTVKPETAGMVEKWKALKTKLQETIQKDRLRTVVLVLQEAAKLEKPESKKPGVSKLETNTAQEGTIVVTHHEDNNSLESQAFLLQVISQRVMELFDVLDPSDSSQLATFQPHYSELMEQQGQFGVLQVEHQKGIVLSPADREQLVEWSNSAVTDRLRSKNPIKMAKLEETLLVMNSRSKDNQGQDQEMATPTATGVSSGSSGSNAALDFHSAQETDEDSDHFEMDISDDDDDEPSDKYFDAMMREAHLEYESSEVDSEDQDDESSSSSSVGAHRDPQNIRSGNDSIQLSQFYSSPKDDYGVDISFSGSNSSRLEQLEKMRKRS
ncbi:Non-canonical poly(A) RNA polymerase papd5 [Linnemannia gamsii]|uniref:polynucleotide adenylyltransferase n=1 Tax=Linnemannia gamsii TaxID=64522 RepID=A0ABQ7JQT1_9FUNG|nr:Non-canonical poly(A) RNA polymerase papd5 [Linnemannia gamsii]